MKLFFAVVFFSIGWPAYAQMDSLLKLSFNERYFILDETVRNSILKADSSKSITHIKSISEFAQKSGNKELQLEAKSLWIRLRITFRNLDDGEIEAEYTKMLEIASKANFQKLLSTIEFDLAEFYWERKSDYNRAMLHYDNAYRIAKELRDEDYYLKQRAIYKFGEKYYFLTDYPNAIQYLLEADQVENPRDPLQPKISINNTLGLAYINQGKLDSAGISFQKGLDYAIEANAKAWIGNLSGNLGHVYILKGDIEKGERLLQIDKTISLEKGAKASASGALLELARLNMDKDNMELAIRQVDSSVFLMNNKISYHRKKALYPLLSKINGYRGAWKTAAAYLDSTIIVIDSLSKKDNSLQLLRLKQRVELEQSKVEITIAEARDRKRKMQIYAMITGLALAIGAVFMILRQKQKTDIAKNRSDELLLNILPANVAEELKATGSAKAKRFSEVTVLFSDFKNFTTYSEQMNPEELVKVLDDYFKGFDQIASEYGLEKIKTVGDAYICVGGLPLSNSKHAEKVARAALKMQDYMKNSQAGWELRIGIHSGPVVAGIVGATKFAYDIWGDTVNVAARMEQNSTPGKINISQATYELIRNEFECTYRGKLEAKNKGVLDMYFIERAL